MPLGSPSAPAHIPIKTGTRIVPCNMQRFFRSGNLPTEHVWGAHEFSWMGGGAGECKSLIGYYGATT